MTLAAFAPDPTWDAGAHEDVVTAFRTLPSNAVIHVWGGDWCGDCRRELPALAAALAAADLAEEQVHVHPVTPEKDGALIAEYDISVVPTVVIEVDGTELARFEEEQRFPAPVALARSIASEEDSIT